MGRANAGKTTILEKVCGVEKGTKPVIVYNKKSKFDTKTQSTLNPQDPVDEKLDLHITPSIEVNWMFKYGLFTTDMQ